jgi:hypothetical protein
VRYIPVFDPKIDGMAAHIIHIPPIKCFPQDSPVPQSMTC